MIRARLSYVAEATGGERVHADVECCGVTTDSRGELAGRLFIPLVGARVDGHAFCGDAVAAGASAFLWQRGRVLPDALRDVPHVLVDDSLVALQSLAKAYRRRLSVRVVGITGSNGKTSTKDMVAAVLATRYRVHKTPGNFNSHIGLPLTILEWDDAVDVAVLEMGMRGLGEIAQLCDIAKPDIGVITNIGEAHLERLGSRANIARAKWELIASLPPGGTAIVPDDEPLLDALAAPAGVRRVCVGETPDALVRLLEYAPMGASGGTLTLGSGEVIHLPIPGRHQARNALCALAVGTCFAIDSSDAMRALETVALSGMRLEVQRLSDRVLLINDAYNASPSSALAALNVLRDTPAEIRIAVLGDMLELGDQAQSFHVEIGDAVAQRAIDVLLCVGTLALGYGEGAQRRAPLDGHNAPEIRFATDATEAAGILQEMLAGVSSRTCAVLLKASRGMQLEIVANAVCSTFGGGTVWTSSH